MHFTWHFIVPGKLRLPSLESASCECDSHDRQPGYGFQDTSGTSTKSAVVTAVADNNEILSILIVSVLLCPYACIVRAHTVAVSLPNVEEGKDEEDKAQAETAAGTEAEEEKEEEEDEFVCSWS